MKSGPTITLKSGIWASAPRPPTSGICPLRLPPRKRKGIAIDLTDIALKFENMSITEIKKSIDAMSREDRIQIQAYLKMKELAEDPGFREKVLRRKREMGTGSSLRSEVVEKAEAVLKSNSR